MHTSKYFMFVHTSNIKNIAEDYISIHDKNNTRVRLHNSQSISLFRYNNDRLTFEL